MLMIEVSAIKLPSGIVSATVIEKISMWEKCAWNKLKNIINKPQSSSFWKIYESYPPIVALAITYGEDLWLDSLGAGGVDSFILNTL